MALAPFLARLTFAVLLAAVVVVSVAARAPGRVAAAGELRRLVLGATALYGAGIAAVLAHHPALGAIAFGGGVCAAALTAWLSRGADRGDDPGDDRPRPPIPPPSDPDGVAPVDWERFDRVRREWARRRPTAPH